VDFIANNTHLDIAEIGKNKIWASFIPHSNDGYVYDLHHERDGKVSRLLKFQLLESDGKSLTGVMFDTSDDEGSNGYTKIGFDTERSDIKLFLEMSSALSNLETKLTIGRGIKLNVLNGKNGAWEIKYP